MVFDIMLYYKISKGEKISIKNNALILSAAIFIMLVMIAGVSAANETDVIGNDAGSLDEEISVEPTQEISSEDTQDLSSENTQELSDPDPVNTDIWGKDITVINGEEYGVKLYDSSSKPLANKTVTFSLNDAESNQTTDENGIARLKIDVSPGKYTIRYKFAEDGYQACQGSSNILVLSSSDSKIKASAYTAYVGVTNKFSLVLTAGDVPLEGRQVVFKIKGKTYKVKTDSNGKASLKIKLAKGKYTLSYSYAGEDKIKSTSGSVKITVKKGMPTKIAKYNPVTYTHKKAGYFKIKLTNSRGTPLKSKKVTFKLNGKTYTRKTNANGIATLKIKLKLGTYKVKVSFKKTPTYNKATKTFSIKVKSSKGVTGGMWLFGRDMKSVSLSKLKKYGIKHVFLNFKALELYGKSGVEKWVKSANAKGIKVHLWMQVFYNGGWQNPVSKGKINYDMINSKVEEAVKYANIKGIDGVHFDYVRYPGSASKYANSVNAVNYFVKTAAEAVHKVNKNIIVSAAIMPEPSSMKSAYAQDVKTMGTYLDALVPMVYKGNYNAGSKWIKSVTSTFKKQSSKAQIWTGLQSYKSDSHVAKLSAKELTKDVRAAVQGGASAVMLFRFGLFNYIDFKAI